MACLLIGICYGKSSCHVNFVIEDLRGDIAVELHHGHIELT